MSTNISTFIVELPEVRISEKDQQIWKTVFNDEGRGQKLMLHNIYWLNSMTTDSYLLSDHDLQFYT